MEHAYIIDGRRSYIGVENGMYKHLPAEVLAAEVLCALVPEDVRQTMEEIMALEPDNVTVHTLAVKRASRARFRQIDVSKTATRL